MSNFGSFVGQVKTRWLINENPHRSMKLLDDFAYVDPQGFEWKAEKGFTVNGASIPEFFWKSIGPPYVGNYRRASVVHDVACEKKDQPSEAVHLMFYYAMRADGVGFVKATTMYRAVKHFGPRWDVGDDGHLESFGGFEELVQPSEELFEQIEKEVQAVVDQVGEDATLEQVEAILDSKHSENEFEAEALPESVQESMKAIENMLNDVVDDELTLESLIDTTKNWAPGSTIKVAFLGGDLDIHQRIEKVVQESIEKNCNLKFDFGFDAETKKYRQWTESDTSYSAAIRISFDISANFSLVGTDSVNRNVGNPDDSVGGRPNQRSLNFNHFHVAFPSDGVGTIIHEFMHAIAFNHEHQNFKGPCKDEFRWEDEKGYIKTKDFRGAFVNDSEGRRPGIYTYLSGFPNFWNKTRTDHNLRERSGTHLQASEFDSASVMLYRFPQQFYKSNPSECAPTGDGQSLSDGDIAALKKLYPSAETDVGVLNTRRNQVEEKLAIAANIEDDGLESIGGLETAGVEANILASPDSAKSKTAIATELRRILKDN